MQYMVTLLFSRETLPGLSTDNLHTLYIKVTFLVFIKKKYITQKSDPIYTILSN